ncbi:hypothetical protein D3C80_1964560 [compost metagenome]
MAGETRNQHGIGAAVGIPLAYLEHIQLAGRHAGLAAQRQGQVLERVLLEQQVVAPLIGEHRRALEQFQEQIAARQRTQAANDAQRATGMFSSRLFHVWLDRAV